MMTETVVNVQEAPINNATKPGAGAPRQGTNENPMGWMKINIKYFTTTPGILKLVEFVFGILCMVLASPAYLSGTHFFLFVATTSFICTVLWIFIYLLGIREGLKIPINWILSELVSTGFWAVMYIIGFIVQLTVAVGLHPILYVIRDTYIAAGVFGLFNALVYCFATYLLYVEFKRTQTPIN